MIDDLTRLSYWFPKLEAAGLPVPHTILVTADAAELSDIYRLFDGEAMTGIAQPLFDRIKAAADAIGYPCFLRTDHFSGKHRWEDTCFIPNATVIQRHVPAIIEFWECVNFVAPPCDVWAVREFLPTIPSGKCHGYGDMPICREFRFFVDGPDIKCWHPYWPSKALEEGQAEYVNGFDYDAFCQPDDEKTLMQLASAAGVAIGGKWSVDLLETRRGWYITDMAESHKSFHWEGCQNGHP